MTAKIPAKTPAQGDIMESVIAKGDLSKLTPEERVRYYNETCKSMGLNPLTQPFSYITLNGKLTLYATRACADQLRKVNGVSLEIVSREVADDILTVHVRARLPDGRVDEELGTVFMLYPERYKDRDGVWKSHPRANQPLIGDDRANAELKCVTKAKRRATLSICGLGWLDETEIADIPASAKRPAPPAKNVMLPLPAHDAETGEIEEDAVDQSLTEDISAAEWDLRLADAANEGTIALHDLWSTIPAEHKPTLKEALDRRHKVTAANVDAERTPA
jgi:hypothetical protein